MRLITRSHMRTKGRSVWAVFCLACVAAVCTAAPEAVKSYAPYPQPDEGYVTDIANLLSAAQEKQLEDWIYACEEENGFEMAVVTIGSIKDYPGTDNGSVEAFATGLFDTYGIGNMPKNDGVLLLVAVKDREARIELGDGYASARDQDAERIMQSVIVPQFRNGRFDRGILNGVQSILLKFGGKDVTAGPKAAVPTSTTPAQDVQKAPDAAPAQNVATAQEAVPAQKVVPSGNTASRHHPQPVHVVQPGRNVVGHGPGGWMIGVLFLGVAGIVVLALVSALTRGRSVSGSYGQNSVDLRDDDETDVVHGDRSRGGGFLSGLLLGGLGSRLGRGGMYDDGIVFGGRSRHNHGIGLGSRHSGIGFGSGGSHSRLGGGRSHGGFGGGFGGGHSGGSRHSSFGGGFSRGGGATGKW